MITTAVLCACPTCLHAHVPPPRPAAREPRLACTQQWHGSGCVSCVRRVARSWALPRVTS